MSCNTSKDVKPLHTTLSVPFKDQNKDGDFPIVWENHGGFAIQPNGGVRLWIETEGFGVPLRLYAPLGTHVGTEVGQLKAAYKGVQVVRGEVLSFNNSQEATLKYPVNYVTITNTKFVDETGAPIGAVLQMTGPGKIRTNKPVYGVAFVNYDAPYQLYEYVYETTATGPSLAEVSGSMITGGSVYAYKGTKFVVHSVPELQFGATEYKESYRVITEVIVDEENVWQKPNDWPDKTFNDGKPDPDEAFLEQEVIHEIGQIADGLCKRQVKYYHPDTGKNPDGQKLVYKLKVQQPDQGCITTHNQIVASVKQRYLQSGKQLVET